MRRHLSYLFIALAFATSIHASDIYQKTQPNWPASYPISGNVTVANFPSTQTVTITNLPSVQTVAGTVAISNSLSVTVSTVGINNPTLSWFKNVSLSTTPVQVKAGSCDIWSFYIYNNATAGNERSIKFYNRSTAPVVGTTIPDWTFTVGGRTGEPMPLPEKVTFPNGLWINATTTSGDTSITAPVAGEISVMVFYR